MKAVVLEDKRKLVVKDIEEPKNSDDVLIEVVMSGICGSDLHYFEAGEPKGLIMGHEFCGKVLNPGNRIDLEIGDLVTALPISPCGHCQACESGNPQYCRNTWTDSVGVSLTRNGALSEKILVRRDMVVKVPVNTEPTDMAMVEPTAVALHAVHLADIKLGAKVLVIGSGIIGMLSALLAKKEGASVVNISEANPNRGQKALYLGVADKCYNAKSQNMVNEAINDSNGGYDVVIECCGNSAAVTTAFATVRPGGTVVLVGVATSAISVPTILAVMNELTVKGAIGYTKDEFIKCVDMIATGAINVKKFIDDIVPFDKVQNAYERLTSGNDAAVKILVNPKL